MLGMFWIALELSNPMVGLILLAKNLTAFKFEKVAKSGNAGCFCNPIYCIVGGISR